MKRKKGLILFSVFFLFFLASVISGQVQEKAPIYSIEVDAIINPATAKFITDSIDEAAQQGAQCLIIQLDTPGGLMESMRIIVKKILASNIPIIVYVAPGGARAASAGVFITIAAHIAVMAPGTHIGAAHPVTLGAEGKESKTMTEKVVNDAVADIKATAKKRGRNVDWAEQAVRKSVSITDDEALTMLKTLAHQYGLLVGPSSGAVAYATLQYAKTLTANDTIVMVMGDSGRAYLTKNYY